MRLLNAKTLEFGEFFDSQVPQYGILSHCWGDGEVSYQQMSPDLRGNLGGSSDGARKIVGCCDLAIRGGLEWVWIDTCCIDKKNNSELTEAINSMYSWYENAARCFVYLVDVRGVPEKGAQDRSADDFQRSRWFTRGWTLQELLASSITCFYNSYWEYIGDRESLGAQISAATRIDAWYLFHIENLRNTASIATKMSWAAKRQTSRLEDGAYSLLGLFGVNMPLLYGEGKKAFLRLQLELITKSHDESIFAWTSEQISSGLLATSPDNFEHTGVVASGRGGRAGKRRPYAMTNKGLKFELPILPLQAMRTKRNLSLTLNCGIGDLKFRDEVTQVSSPWMLDRTVSKTRKRRSTTSLAITIELCKFDDAWQRVNCHEIWLSDSSKIVSASQNISRILHYSLIIPQPDFNDAMNSWSFEKYKIQHGAKSFHEVDSPNM